MADLQALSTLQDERAALAHQIERLQADLAQSTADLASIDIAIRTEKLGHPPTERARKGTVVRLIINSLRAASGPMTARQLAVLQMEALGLDPTDKRLAHTMRERVRRTLRRLRAKGTVREVPTTGPYKGWKMAS